MNSPKGKNNTPLSIDMFLIIIVIILVLILICVSVLNIGKKKKPIGNNINNETTNDVTNEVEEPHNTTNKVNKTVNTTVDPNANNPEVAQIGDETYTSLQEAINAVDEIVPTATPSTTPTPTPTPIEPTKITLLKDITGTFIVGANKYIILDMNNHSISAAGDKEVFSVNGELELQNGKITAKHKKQNLCAIRVNKSGTLICNKMNVDLSEAELGWAITSDGILNIKSSKINYPKGTAVNNNGTIEEISGETSINSSDNYIALYNVGTINKIIAGEIVSNSYALFNSGTIEEISGNTKIVSALSYGIYNSGTMGNIIDDVEITSGAENTATIYNNGGRIKKIAGNVKINAEHNRAIYNMGIITEISGNVNINTNGEYAVSTIYNSNPGELTIMGGTITHKNGGISVFREGGEVTITGGSISSKYNC